MKRAMFSSFVVVGLVLAGCGKGGSSDPVARMKSFRDQMCACAKSDRPAACVPKINVGKKQWEEGLKEGAVPAASQAEFDAADREFDACRDRANGESP